MTKTFKCEICGCITPIECEGGYQNVCADCFPVEVEDTKIKIIE